ncbi:MAG TPA: L-arabinose isomerase, partial [Exiguobacterium sp.]|nr:L-arabinose isomerase [Exiguobacterium sp.]
MLTANTHEFWFVTGSQMLYGEEVLRQVETHSKEMVSGLDAADVFRNRIVYKGVVKNAEEIRQMMLRANADDACAGVITWMHTFSPSKMWISGMRVLQKPLLHFGTQFNRDIPWDAIDMDFMNLNQSAHGDREHGFITSRMNVKRKVLVGHWEDELTRQKMSSWMNVAHALAESKNLKVARFGDNMRNVAVTEGDKVEAQIQLGWTVDGYGVGDLVTYMNAVSESDLDDLMEEYRTRYEMTNTGMEEEAFQESVRYQGRIELGMKAFLEAGGYTAFTTTFE